MTLKESEDGCRIGTALRLNDKKIRTPSYPLPSAVYVRRELGFSGFLVSLNCTVVHVSL